jgi:hypothetical protein
VHPLARPRLGGELLDKARLADAALSADEHDGRRALVRHSAHRLAQLEELPSAPGEGQGGHARNLVVDLHRHLDTRHLRSSG